jgi:hypothetical protein
MAGQIKSHPNFIVVCVLFLTSLLSPQANSELYVAGQGGVTLPNKFTNIEGTGRASSISVSELELADAFVYGLKAGGFLPGPLKWLGLEADLFHATPHIKQQTVRVTAPGGSVTTHKSGAHVNVITGALNLMLRAPLKRVQPYLGAGPAVFGVRVKDEEGSTYDVAVGVNAIAGIRLFLVKYVAWFGEYKYNRATFEFDDAYGNGMGLKGDYSANHFLGGIAFHF